MPEANAERTKTALYRYFDAEGALLYVGISFSPAYRQAQHRDGSPWYELIANMSVAWFDSRQEAIAAECEAIRAEKPKHNVIHNRPMTDREARMAEMADDSRLALNRSFAGYQPSYTVKAASVATGIGESGIRWAMAAGDLGYYPTGYNNVCISGWALIDYMQALESGVATIRRSPKFDDGRTARLPTGEWLANNVGRVSVEAWLEHLVALWTTPEAQAA